MKNLLSLIIDAAKNDDMNRVIELAENQQDKFCDNNCVWTDHHPKCVRAEPEWYHVIDVHGCNRFYHRTEDCPYKVKTPLYTTPQPKQEQGEPVAWYIQEKDSATTDGCWAEKNLDICEPLYTTPPQRTWVGLTYEEISKVLYDSGDPDGLPEYARAIEAKLKEKNAL